MTSHHDNRPGGPGLLLGAGAAIGMIACCALLPLLVLGGTLAGAGAFLRNPWVIGAGALVAAIAIGYALARRAGADGVRDDCCQRGTHDGSAVTPDASPNHTDRPTDHKGWRLR